MFCIAQSFYLFHRRTIIHLFIPIQKHPPSAYPSPHFQVTWSGRQVSPSPISCPSQSPKMERHPQIVNISEEFPFHFLSFFTRMSAFFSLNFVCSTLGYVGWHQLPHVSFSWWCRRVVLKSVLALRWGSLHSMHGSFYLAHKVWPWFSQNFHSIHSMLDNVAEGARKWRGNSLPPTERGFKDTGILPLMMKEIVAPENILNVLNIL